MDSNNNSHILKEILDLARTELNRNGRIGYTMPDGRHHIYIYVDDSIRHVKDATPEDYYYVIEPNRVVNDAHEPMGDTATAEYNDFAELLVGCMWCMEAFEHDKDYQRETPSFDGKSGPSRIIVDSYAKKKKHTLDDENAAAFNQKILAVNNMYGWLYDRGILERESFVFKDYPDGTEFALDARQLLPYRQEMERSGVEDAALAVRHIFDEDYTPCRYSGAIQLGWMMHTYRSVDGCVGSSWECDLIKSLNTEGVYEISDIQRDKGVFEAVKALFSLFNWEPTLKETTEYSALLGTKDYAYLKEHMTGHDLTAMNNIIEAYNKNRISLEIVRNEDESIDFTKSFGLVLHDPSYKLTGAEQLVIKWYEGFEDTGYLFDSFGYDIDNYASGLWQHCEGLLGEPITHKEFKALDALCGMNLADINATDRAYIDSLHKNLHSIRNNKDELDYITPTVKVSWTNLGEGWNGDYNPADPLDDNLLRFDVYVLQDGKWEVKDNSSRCTRFSADSSLEEKSIGLRILGEEFRPALSSNKEASVRNISDRMSYISLDDVNSAADIVKHSLSQQIQNAEQQKMQSIETKGKSLKKDSLVR